MNEKLQAEVRDTLRALGAVFDAIPKGKFAKIAKDASDLERGLRRAISGLALLDGLRGYFLECTGDESPFVVKIDQIIPRP